MELDKEIISYIENGDTETALTRLIEYCRTEKADRLKEAIVIKADFEETKIKHHAGLIENSEWQLKKNNVRYAVLSMLGETPKPLTHVDTIPSKRILHPVALWIGLIAFIITIFFLYKENFFYEKEQNAKELKKLNTEVENAIIDNLGLSIYPAYQDVYVSKNYLKKTKVIEDAKSFIKLMSFYDNKNLDLNTKIYSSIATMTSYKILSLLSNDKAEQINYSAKGLEACANASSLIHSIKDIQNVKEAKKIQKWVEDERHETRLLIHDFILKCVNNRSGGYISREQLIQSYNALPSDKVLTEEGYDSYPIVEWFYSEFKTQIQ